MYDFPKQVRDTWIKLSDAQPALGSLCKWWVIYGQVDEMGEGFYMPVYSRFIDKTGKGRYVRVTTTINGQEVGARGFSTSKGIMFSPPEHTFWKEQN
jgi:hypothetical protein